MIYVMMLFNINKQKLQMNSIGTILYTILFGNQVGYDNNNNKFYTNKNKSKRWVIYDKVVDPSAIGVNWHSWLHYTTNIVPRSGKDKFLCEWQKSNQGNDTGSSHIVIKENNNDYYKAWDPNENS